jgi:hypothetical protein
MGRLATAAVFATTLEWFDFLIYATAAALVLGPQFFPSENPVAGTLRRSRPSPSGSSRGPSAASWPGTPATDTAASPRSSSRCSSWGWRPSRGASLG